MATRIKKTLSYVPASLSEAVTFLVSIGKKQIEINKLKREAKAKIESIKEDTDQKVALLTVDRDNFFTALFSFASARKEELTKVTRSQKTSAGTFGWRWTTPYVDIKEGVEDAVIIARLKAKGLTQYIRVIEELDREAMLRDHPEVKDVEYSNRDEFFAKPKLTKEEGSAVELACVAKNTEAVDVK